MRKGVSPLIAMALLIMIVVAAAFLVGEWVKPFATEQTDRAEREARQFHVCKNTYVRILDLSASQTEVNITIMNAGLTDLSTINIIALGDAQIIGQSQVTDLASSEHRALRLSTDAEPDRIAVIPKECPQMTTQAQP